MKNPRQYYSPLARRIGIYVILVSACITLITSGVQLYAEYKRDVNGVHARIDQLETTQLSNIASRVWVLDTTELERTLKALLELQSIEYIAVYDYDNLLMEVGQDFDKNAVVVRHSLKYEHNNKVLDIGSIIIKASLDEVYSLIIDRAAIIILSNGLKTFIVAGFILFIFYHLVARHLQNIARHAQYKDFLNTDVDLELDRKPNNNETDELDTVVHSINSLRTELLKQFSELKTQQKYLSLTLDSIGDAVITTTVDGYITRMNPVAEKLTGWSISEAKNRSINTVFPIIDSVNLEPIGNIVGKVINSDLSSKLSDNTLLFSRDGNEYHISYMASPIKDDKNELLGIVITFHDITEQYLLREKIANNKRELQSILDNSPSVIYIKDINGKYLFVNKLYEKIFNIKREDILDKTDYEIFDKDLADVYKRNDDNVKRAGHVLEIEETARHADGEMHTYASLKFPLLDDTGNIYAICGQSTDITDRKIHDMNFRRAQKMDALGKLTSGIAHDYNNMLGIILGYAQLLESMLKDKPTLQKYAVEIHRAGDRGSKLTKKLLDFSSQDTSDAANVDINRILKEGQHMLEKTLTARIRLTLKLEEDLWIALLDSGDLEDAIVNMCINASHAIEDKGEIIIETLNKTLEKRDADRLNIDAGEYILLSISDNGCGMDEQTKDRIFDPFYSTKGSKGTGLGLSQVYGFMERSAGAIDVITSPSIGTRFELYFPRSRANSEIASKTAALELEESLNGSETVLVVDDEPSLVNLVNESLLIHGYNVITANNGQQALEILKQKPVDLIITDIIMPKLDGTQLAAEVQKHYPHIKMQIVSGYTDDKINSLIEGGLARKILYKPFSMEDLISRVRELLEDKNNEEKLAGRRVLVMDDMLDMRDLYKVNLKKLGCEVVTAADGEEAIEIYKKAMNNGKSIDVVILDLSIPGGMDGMEVAKQIRKINPEARLILASGYTEFANESQNKTDKFIDAVVEKNFNRAKLKEVLEAVLS